MKSTGSLKKTVKGSQIVSKTRYTVVDPFVVGVEVNIVAERLVSANGNRKRGLYFTYLRHVENTETGSIWIDVLDKSGTIRSFKPEQVTVKPVKRKRKRKVQ